MAIVRNVSLFATLATLAGSGAALAQSPAAAPGMPPTSGGAGLRSGNIAATGQTVPNPQTLPSAPRSTVDDTIKGKDAGRTDYGICKGC